MCHSSDSPVSPSTTSRLSIIPNSENPTAGKEIAIASEIAHTPYPTTTLFSDSETAMSNCSFGTTSPLAILLLLKGKASLQQQQKNVILKWAPTDTNHLGI